MVRLWRMVSLTALTASVWLACGSTERPFAPDGSQSGSAGAQSAGTSNGGTSNGGTSNGGTSNADAGDGGTGAGTTCEPEARRCSFNQPQICSDDGSEWVDEPACEGDTPSCIAERGECGKCTEGERQCGNGSTPQECDDRGKWLTELECDDSVPYCVDGECRECNPLLEPGRRCTDNTPEVCDDGEWTAEEPCSGETPACIEATGLCGCEPGARRCADGNTPELCTEGEWGTEPDCEAGVSICNDDTGSCECLSDESECVSGVQTGCVDGFTKAENCELGCTGDECRVNTVAVAGVVTCDPVNGLYCNTPDNVCSNDLTSGAKTCTTPAGSSGTVVACDGPGDCPAGKECCQEEYAPCGVFCVAAGTCAGPSTCYQDTKRHRVCDPDASDCPNGETCVPVPSGEGLYQEDRHFICK